MRMIRKQVYIEPLQEALLKESAEAFGVSEAEVIRRGIGLVAMQGKGVKPRTTGSHLRDQAWREIAACWEQRRQLHAPQTGRAWTREDLYEDRVASISD